MPPVPQVLRKEPWHRAGFFGFGGWDVPSTGSQSRWANLGMWDEQLWQTITIFGFQMFVDSKMYHFIALDFKGLLQQFCPEIEHPNLDASRCTMRMNRRSMETIDIPSWIYWIMDVLISINIYWPYTCNFLTLLSFFLLKSNRPIARVNNIV